MGLTLSNMTGLALHSSISKQPRGSKDSEDENEDDSVGEDDTSKEQKNENKNKRKNEEAKAESSKGYSSEASENLYKKFKVANGGNKSSQNLKIVKEKSNDVSNRPNETPNEQNAFLSDNKLNEIIRSDTPKCYFEVRRWKEGFYTLVNDDDEQIKTQALDLMVFFHTKSWNLEMGGNVSYIARDEDTELLTVGPEDEDNCVALVFRDEETLKFTKYVNSKIRKINNSGCFYEISVVYYE
jgi:hypothetical protein